MQAIPFPVPPAQVLKRGGSSQAFDSDKIRRAITKAFEDIHPKITSKHESDIAYVARTVVQALSTGSRGPVSVEGIQDTVEAKLMEAGHYRASKAYILWRDLRARARAQRKRMPPGAVSDYTTCAKYARWRKDLQRRELYNETVDRLEGMHLRRYPQLESLIRWSMNKVRAQETLPSMRSMQFGGEAIEVNHHRMYNCAFSLCDRPRFFAEAFYLLLCGCGVGFSVQKQHVAKLPPLKEVDETRVKHYIIPDDIEGWGYALEELFKGHIEGYYVEFAYHLVRDRGEGLSVSGGKAPGHLPLRKALECIRTILTQAAGRKLRPIEAYDIMCHGAEAVLSGGVRRSAMLALFSLDDDEMMTAKTGNWYSDTPWRSRSNNSVVLRRDAPREEYDDIFEHTKQWGEPGLYFTDDEDTGANPCVEIGLNPVLSVEEDHIPLLQAEHPGVAVGDCITGWQMCNLSESNGAKFTSVEQALESIKAAAVLGTLQAGYTDFFFLGEVSKIICRREALIGVSMTGMMDVPEIAFDEDFQREAAKVVRETNQEVAALIGINPAARTTCVKPSGTASLALGCIGSGIHPHHARRYFRRITAHPQEPPYLYFKSINPHMCEKTSNPNADIITFCVEAPENAVLRDDLTALEFLQKVLDTKKHWVQEGTARPDSSPGVTHNVSNTITVREDEWDDVREFLWEHREYFSGVSMLSYVGDKEFTNAPREAVVNEVDEERWAYLVGNYTPVDYTQFLEVEDNTDLKGEVACSGGACEF